MGAGGAGSRKARACDNPLHEGGLGGVQARGQFFFERGELAREAAGICGGGEGQVRSVEAICPAFPAKFFPVPAGESGAGGRAGWGEWPARGRADRRRREPARPVCRLDKRVPRS